VAKNKFLNSKRSGAAIFAVLLSGSFLFVLINYNWQLKKLNKNKIVTTGICTRVEAVLKNRGLHVDYNFITRQNENRTGRYRVLIENKYKNELIALLVNKSLPVIYDSTDLSNNRILVMKDDFLDFNCPMPDSLMPLINYLDSIKY
jgi:hypothetical protein